MIGPEHEQPQRGEGNAFFDSISIDFCDPEHELFGLVRSMRLPNLGRTAAMAVLFSHGEVLSSKTVDLERAPEQDDRTTIDGLSLATVTPLERWSLSIADGARLDLEARAASPPLDLTDPVGAAVARVAGVTRYEQLCRVRGTADVGGKTREVSCPGRRSHTWGVHDWTELERWRAIYAVSEDRGAVTVAGALPAGSAGHGDELRSGHLVSEDEPLGFEETRVSTVYAADGLPAKVGLELFVPGQELPRRVSGVAVCGASLEVADQTTSVSFLRWSIDGAAASGCYESVVGR